MLNGIKLFNFALSIQEIVLKIRHLIWGDLLLAEQANFMLKLWIEKRKKKRAQV